MSNSDAARNDVPTRHRRQFVAHIAATTVVGLAVLAGSLWAAGEPSVAALAGSLAFWLALALVVFGEVRPLFLPGLGDPTGIATSAPFAFAALLHFGLPAAALLHATASVVTGLARRRAWWRTGFNVAQYTLSLAASAAVLAAFGYVATPLAPAVPKLSDLLVIALAGVAYFVVNDGLVGIAVSRMIGRSVFETVRLDFAYQAVVTTALLGVAPLVAVVMGLQGGLIPLFILPLIAIYKNAEVSVAREREALHDGLTGLANRTLLLERTQEVLADAARTSSQAALFLLDLDRFKEVNDTLGHPVGDRVLQIVACRLEGALRPGDVVARLGGDEFAVLLPQVSGAEAARDIAERVCRSLDEPIHLDGTLIDLDASLGIALYPDHGDSFDHLHQRADVAMYVAKAAGHGIEVYAPEKDNHSPQRLGLLGALRRAVETGGLELHYQPKVSLTSGHVVGVEALVRWQHPTYGMVMPDDFIPLAEQSGLMPRLTDVVVDEALGQVARWRAGGLDVVVAVNISVRDLLDPGFAARIGDGLLRHAVPAHFLTLEITERVLMADFERTAEVLLHLRAQGVRISLDDFGTGYSSLTLLKQLPVCELKIDRSFVSRIGESEADATIVGSIVDLAHALGLSVVSEGVETADAMAQLDQLGCDEAQGWLVSRPMPAVAATEWLIQRAGSDVPAAGVPAQV